MKLYLKISTDYKAFIKALLLITIFIDALFFFLFSYDILSIRIYRMYIGLISFFGFVFFNSKNEFNECIKKYSHIKYFLFYAVIVMITESLYSILIYKENIYDVTWASTHFLLLFLLPILIFYFENDKNDKSFRHLMILGICSALLNFLAVSFEELGIPHILLGVPSMGSRYGHARLGITNIGTMATIYLFSKIIEEKSKKKKITMLVILGFILVAFVFFQATRMANIGLAAAYILMLLCYRNDKNKKIIYLLIVIVAVCAIVVNSDTIFGSFSVDSEQGASTVARLMGIAYFREILKENPLMGMGLIRPRNSMLLEIWSGPYGTFYLDDLGTMGGIFETGIIGSLLYLFPLLRMIYVSYRLYKVKESHYVFAVGMTMYYFVSQMSLSYLSQSRVIGMVIVWAYLEVLYKRNSEELMGNN